MPFFQHFLKQARGVFFILIALACLHPYTGAENYVYAQEAGGGKMAITITSSAFIDGGIIPKKHTCDGSNISPPLSWSGLPKGARSIALICDDPDAPAGTWVHWVLFNIPVTVRELPRDIPAEKTLDSGAQHGINDFRKYGYGGPCPPSGTHRYYFKIYALNSRLALQPGITKAELIKAMAGHILSEGRLMGTYKR